jgi:CRP/FNR family cyclic AMP-dependent transcriptional regulator
LLKTGPSARTYNITMSKKIAQGLIDELQQLAVFSRCSQKELEALTRIGTVIRVDPGYTFMRQGRRGWEFFVVMDGMARCVVNGHAVAQYEQGDFFGEMAIIDNAPRSATVEAETGMTVLVVDSREFATMLERAPSTVRPVLSAMAHRLRAAQGMN